MMQPRRYGQTDLYVSPICFGPMRFASKTPGDDLQSKAGERALVHALKRGIDFLHSSYEYGTRWAMERVLKDHPGRAEIKHIIKVPVPDFQDTAFSATLFRSRVEEALRELHTDRIDVVQWLVRAEPNNDPQRLPRIATSLAAALEIFGTLHAEGKVGVHGVFQCPLPLQPR